MDIALAILLLAAVLAALAYPLYISRPHPQIVAADTLNDLLAQRDGLYATLRDLDLDYELGKMDHADYVAAREKYLARAAALLAQLDELRGDAPSVAEASEEIEREVAALRRTRTTEPEQPSSGVCPNCAHINRAGARFCDNCGKPLQPNV
jgi:hypothetical protein